MKLRQFTPQQYVASTVDIIKMQGFYGRCMDVGDSYTKATTRFHDFELEFNLNFENIHVKASELIVREGAFILDPTQEEHDNLAREWTDLCMLMIHCMENVNVTPDRSRLMNIASETFAFRLAVLSPS